jgi:nitrogenase iron protein NifH
LEDISVVGFKGVVCIEAGGPVPGVGCAGRGINAAVSLLQDLHLFEEYKPDFVLYDVLGDVVCGGFAVPIREGLADKVYVVSSSDFMAIYAANNLFKAITKYASTGGARLGGIIANSLNAPYAKSLIDDFAEQTGAIVTGYVPRSLTVAQSELYGKTVIEAQPDSAQADVYRKLAQRIIEDAETVVPLPMNVTELRDWARKWGDQILRIEQGEVLEQASI